MLMVLVFLIGGLSISPTVVNAVGEPTVSWSTADNQTYAGVVTLSATAAATSSWISKWCLQKDGVAVTTDISKAYSGRLSSATFIVSTGCWTQSTSSSEITSGYFMFDTTSWADGAHTYQITVTDSNNRTTTGSLLTINTVNPLPKLTVVGLVSGSTVVGTVSVETSVVFDVSQRDSIERKSTRICLDNQSQCVDDDSFSIAPGRIKNGQHTLSISTTDSIGRVVTAPPITFTTQNSGAAISSMRKQVVKPTWKAKTVKVDLSIGTSNATEYEVRYGLSAKSLNKRAGGALEGSESDSDSLSISGLKPNTKYFFRLIAIGINGSSGAKVITTTTAKIPPKPKKIGTTCIWTRQYDSRGFAYYKYYDRYRWSDGTYTLSPTYSSYNFPC
jgi:Tfp pilus assembly protein PilX